MTLSPKDWTEFIKSLFAMLVIVGAVGAWAGDVLFVTDAELEIVQTKLYKKIGQTEINQLDREITFLQIKINQNEATASERIYIETLRQQYRTMVNHD